jgi:hypothetical protein
VTRGRDLGLTVVNTGSTPHRSQMLLAKRCKDADCGIYVIDHRAV